MRGCNCALTVYTEFIARKVAITDFSQLAVCTIIILRRWTGVSYCRGNAVHLLVARIRTAQCFKAAGQGNSPICCNARTCRDVPGRLLIFISILHELSTWRGTQYSYGRCLPNIIRSLLEATGKISLLTDVGLLLKVAPLLCFFLFRTVAVQNIGS